MTYGSVFSGVGGIDLGLDRAGLECRWQVENDPYAIRVLEKHWPGVKRHGDITKITGDELEPVDLICGGFPCQDLSQAGKQAGIEGTRSGLWFEYARLVRRLRPRYVLIENVAGLLVHDAMRRVVGELARLGYVGCWRSIRASEFGASHLRKRVFIVAYSQSGGLGELRQPSECNGLADRGHAPLAYSALQLHDGAGIAGQPANGHRTLADTHRKGLEVGDGKRELQFHRDSTALPSGLSAFAPGPSDPRWPAILRERPDLAPALESPVRGVADGIPDWTHRAMKDRTKRLGRLGNSVVPQISEWVGRRILKFDEAQG